MNCTFRSMRTFDRKLCIFCFFQCSVGGGKKVARALCHPQAQVVDKDSKGIHLEEATQCTHITCITIIGWQWLISKWLHQANQDSSRQMHRHTCQWCRAKDIQCTECTLNSMGLYLSLLSVCLLCFCFYVFLFFPYEHKIFFCI